MNRAGLMNAKLIPQALARGRENQTGRFDFFESPSSSLRRSRCVLRLVNAAALTVFQQSLQTSR